MTLVTSFVFVTHRAYFDADTIQMVDQSCSVIRRSSATITALGESGSLLMESFHFFMFIMTVDVARCFLLIYVHGFLLSTRI